MSGLEKILSQIEYESDERCRSIIEDAKKKADRIIGNARDEAEAILKSGEEETAKKVERINQGAVSSAELGKSKLLLRAKLEIIDEILEKSLDKIKKLPEDEYFDIIKTLILANAKSGEGTLCLCEKDIGRLPEGFIASINKAPGDKEIILGDATDIDSGFILRYGDIDVNCSFDAIVQEKRDELRDALNSLLFE